MNNLVTGSSGFLGSHLVEALIARGEQVRALVRPTSQTAHLENLGVELAYSDLSDAASLETALQAIDRVYHCAALAADWGTWEAFRAANVTGVENLMAAALGADVSKIVHVSTTDVYGHPDYPADESAPFRLRGWPYGDTKIEGERIVWNYYRQHGLPVTVVRPVNVYGPRSTTFVMEIVDLLKQGGMIHIGRSKKPAGLTYVTNVVDVICRAADSDESVGQAYNACDGSNVTWRQYVDRLAEIVGVPSPRIVIPHRLAYLLGWGMEKTYRMLRIDSRPLLTRMTADVFSTDQGFPIEKARRELGYEPKIDFDEGMRRVEAWLREIDAI
ncbi:MAG TPA: NAD-dependent epimerase/dehydratase family protein [Chloroflexi bacterium]|nr:NAD-dependent epimerase/dehydratase family protein [Chloroflexota bacterium]